MKKVTFVIDYLGMGGEQRVTTMIANEFTKKNDVEVVTFYGNKKPYYNLRTPIVAFPRENKLNLIMRKSITRVIGGLLKRDVSPFFMNKGHRDRLKKHLETRKPDTVILVAELPYYVEFIKKEFPKIKIILWFHQSFSIYYERVFRYSRKLFIQSCQGADEIILLTKIDVKKAESFQLNAKCIYNPLTLNGTREYKDCSKTIGFAGRFAINQKGIDYLPKVATNLSDDWKLVMAGNGTYLENKRVKKLFRDVNTQKYIFLGQLEHYEVKKFLSGISIYTMTSRWEGLPLILLEAMSFGLPIIAFEQNGSKEILGDGEYGILVPQGDIKSFNNQIEHMIANKDFRKKYSDKSLQRIDDFNLPKIIQQWEEVI